MPFSPTFAEICPNCPHGQCVIDVRKKPIPGRDTKFRINQTAAVSCTFDSIAPGSENLDGQQKSFDEYITQFARNVAGAGQHLFGDTLLVKAGATSKVEGDLFELLLSAALWNAAAVWNKFMVTGVWPSKVFLCPPNAVPSPLRRVAIVQLPRGYDSTKLFDPATRAALEAFEVALQRQDSELRLSCPDIVGIRLPDNLPDDGAFFDEQIENLGASSQAKLGTAYKTLEGLLHGRSLLFAIAAKRSVRSDRLYQPLFEANVLKFLVGEVLKGSSFRFHVHAGSFEGADVEGHYRAASLVSLLRGGTPSRAVDRLHLATHPVGCAQVILDELTLFPL